MDITIRELQIEDLHDVMEIEEACFSVPWSEESFKAEIRHQNTYYNCIEINNKVIGYAGLWKILDEGHITNIAVIPKYRKKGYGKKLVENILQYCSNNDIDRVTLEVRESNNAAKKLYIKMGFEAAGIRRNYYTKPTENAEIMWKEI